MHILIHTCVFIQHTYNARTDPYIIRDLENTACFGSAAMRTQSHLPYGLEPATGLRSEPVDYSIHPRKLFLFCIFVLCFVCSEQ